MASGGADADQIFSTGATGGGMGGGMGGAMGQAREGEAHDD